jgi:hypothetical protein
MTSRILYHAPDDQPCRIDDSDLVALPEEFIANVAKLRRDLTIALDCFLVFGAVPRAIAQDVLKNIGSAQAGFDIAAKSGGKAAR